MNRDDLVQTMFDTGAMGAQFLFGVVEKSGPKTMTIRWESGIRNRVPQGRSDVTLIQDLELQAEARKKLGTAREALCRRVALAAIVGPVLPIGAYILGQDVPNPKRNDRDIPDWRHVETFKKGTKVRVTTGSVVEPWDSFPYMALALDDPRFLVMLPHLSLVKDPVDLLDEKIRQLTNNPLDKFAAEVLAVLLRSGEVCPERVLLVVKGICEQMP